MALLTKKELLQFYLIDSREFISPLQEIEKEASLFSERSCYDFYISFKLDDFRIALGLKRILGKKGYSGFVQNCDNRENQTNYRILEKCTTLFFAASYPISPFKLLPWQIKYMLDINRRISIVPILEENISLYGIETLWDFPYLDYTENDFYIHSDSSSWINMGQWLKGLNPKKFNL